MIFREAVMADLQGILDLYQQLGPGNTGYSPEKARGTWEAILANPALRYFVAEDGGAVVGTCSISVIPNLSRGVSPFAVIENVVTDSAYRNRGIGKALMGMAIDFAKRSGCYKVVLMSGAQRTEAHAFYEKLGFNGSSKKGFDLRLS